MSGFDSHPGAYSQWFDGMWVCVYGFSYKTKDIFIARYSVNGKYAIQRLTHLFW